MDANRSSNSAGAPTGRDPTDSEYALLRRLLLAPEQMQIEEMQRALKRLKADPNWIARLIPDALVIEQKGDNRIYSALAPLLKNAIAESIRHNPVGIAHAIAPVLGSAIRFSVMRSLREMVVHFNAIALKLFSPQGILWRIESMRTGKPYGEIVLLHTLMYRAVAVYLIQNESGILLYSVTAPSFQKADPDFISGMLTAIQDFARDSLENDGDMETLSFGGKSIIVEHGQHAAIAAVVEGIPPPAYRKTLEQCCEKVNLYWREELENKNGDTSVYAQSEMYLQECLTSQMQEPSGRRYTKMASAAAIVIIVALGVFLFATRNSKWHRAFERLGAAPGIAITSVQSSGGKWLCEGFRDPLSIDPREAIRQEGLDAQRVAFNWKYFYAVDDTFLLLRAGEALQPPATAFYRVRDGICTIYGEAPHSWIVNARTALPRIAGLRRCVFDSVENPDMRRLDSLRSALEASKVFFPWDSDVPRNDQDAAISRIGDLVIRICKYADSIGVGVRLIVNGHTDRTGAEMRNNQLSRKRALYISERLEDAAGEKMLELDCIGKAWHDPAMPKEETEEDRQRNRRVTFELQLQKAKSYD